MTDRVHKCEEAFKLRAGESTGSWTVNGGCCGSCITSSKSPVTEEQPRTSLVRCCVCGFGKGKRRWRWVSLLLRAALRCGASTAGAHPGVTGPWGGPCLSPHLKGIFWSSPVLFVVVLGAGLCSALVGLLSLDLLLASGLWSSHPARRVVAAGGEHAGHSAQTQLVPFICSTSPHQSLSYSYLKSYLFSM